MMWFKYISIFLLLLFGFSEASVVDTLKLHGKLDAKRKEIDGYIEYTIQDNLRSDSVVFQLFANLYSSDTTALTKNNELIRESLRLSGTYGETIIDSIKLNDHTMVESYTASENKLIIRPGKLESNNKLSVYFKTRIPKSDDRLTYNHNEYLLDGWFPFPALLNDAGDWYMPIYSAHAELVSDFYYYDVSFECPHDFIVAAPSVPLTREANDSIQINNYIFGPAHDFVMAISPHYLLDTFAIDDMMVTTYYHENEHGILPTVHDICTKAFGYMIDNIGPYIYDRFTIVLSSTGLGGGVEFPAMTALMSPSGNALNSRLYSSLLTHEIIHQWFYGALNSDQSRSPWLDESITNYFTNKIMEYYFGPDTNLISWYGFEVAERDELRFSSLFSVDRNPMSSPAGYFVSGTEYYSVIYSRGALVIETIDNLMDKSTSNVFWKKYYNDNILGRPDNMIFLDQLEESGGKNLRLIAEQLISNNTKIDFAVDKLENNSVDSVNYEIELILSTTMPSLNILIDYELILGNGDTLHYTWEPKTNVERIYHRLPSLAVEARIDPGNKLAVDADLLNNSYKYIPDSKPAMRVSSGLMLFLETLLSLAGGF